MGILALERKLERIELERKLERIVLVHMMVGMIDRSFLRTFESK